MAEIQRRTRRRRRQQQDHELEVIRRSSFPCGRGKGSACPGPAMAVSCKMMVTGHDTSFAFIKYGRINDPQRLQGRHLVLHHDGDLLHLGQRSDFQSTPTPSHHPLANLAPPRRLADIRRDKSGRRISSLVGAIGRDVGGPVFSRGGWSARHARGRADRLRDLWPAHVSEGETPRFSRRVRAKRTWRLDVLTLTPARSQGVSGSFQTKPNISSAPTATAIS